MAALAVGAMLMVGCESMKWSSTDKPETKPAAAAPAAKPATPAPTPTPAVAKTIIRVRAGNGPAYKDKAGNTWEADRGFLDGQTVDRAADLQITGTNDPDLFRTERYSMSGYTFTVPNGKYTVNLYFAETYEGISGVGQRVFSFSVQGKEHKDFDLWKETGGFARVKVITEVVDVTNGKIEIKFTPNIENPEINGIEIIPE